MFTPLIVIYGSDRCLVSTMNRRSWQSTSHRKQSGPSTDYLRDTAYLLANRSSCWCPGQFGKRSTGPLKDSQASRANFFAKGPPLLSRARNATRRAANKSQPLHREPLIFVAKLVRQIWRG